MAKNYESESKNSRNYTGTSDKNSYGNEMNHAGNVKNSVKSKNETDCRSKAKNKTSQSYSSEEDGASTLARNKNYYKPQKCGLFYVKFYLFLCCTELYFIFICDIMRYETQL